jgi:hypothetical protein
MLALTDGEDGRRAATSKLCGGGRSMETLKDILWPVVLVGGLGAFIDFLIGKTGQQKAKDLLLEWWVRFDDVRWKNFGREEGLFAGHLIERWFGRRIWSFSRLKTAFALLSIFLLIGYLNSLISSKSFIVCGLCSDNISFGMNELIVSLLAFSISVSLTKLITFRMADLCGVGEVRNLVIFVMMTIINYLILIYWAPIAAESRRGVILNLHSEVIFPVYIPTALIVYTFSLIKLVAHVITTNTILGSNETIPFYPKIVIDYVKWNGPIDILALFFLSIFPSVFRFALSIIFVGSFLLRPLVMRPVSLVWARIVESEKPVFTVIFGGTAAFATAITEAAKHLSG